MWLAFRTLVRGELAELRFMGAYRYVVRGSALGTVDAEPASQTLGLPSLLRVPVLPGVLGEQIVATVGASCVVVFLDGDPTLPRVTAVSGVDSAKVAAGTRGIARLTDTIVLGYCLWDSITTTLYFSPAALGPTLTVYVPWAVFPTGTTLSLFSPNPSSPIPPSPGTPGTAWSGQISSASSVVTCG
jgi:hypothetical protein